MLDRRKQLASLMTEDSLDATSNLERCVLQGERSLVSHPFTRAGASYQRLTASVWTIPAWRTFFGERQQSG